MSDSQWMKMFHFNLQIFIHHNGLINRFKLTLLVFLIVANVYFAENVNYYSVIRPKPGFNTDSLLKYRLVKLEKLEDFATDNEYSQASRNSPSSEMYMKIDLFGKNYGIVLKRAESVFTDDAQIVIPNRNGVERVYDAKDFDLPILVEGCVVSTPNSSVFGLLNGGIFQGDIRIRGEDYAIEPAEYYFDGVDSSDVIVYNQKDLSIPLSSNLRSCKSPSKMWQEMGIDAKPRKRLESSNLRGHTGRVCKMGVVSDHYFFDLHGGNIGKTIADMEYHIAAADRIFRETDFDNDNIPDGIRIRVRGVIVYHTPYEYGFSSPKLNATEYLRLFSTYDHSRYCAAMAFTYQKVPGGTLGYAYRGGKQYFGGICTPRKVIGRVLRSMNVGMVSLMAPWGQLYRVQSTIVVTHEIGHMFGSPHDDHTDGGICHSKNKEKQYIMSAKANPGTSQNNRKFSICSKRHILENVKLHGQCLICKGTECYARGTVVLLNTLQRIAILFTTGILRLLLRILQQC